MPDEKIIEFHGPCSLVADSKAFLFSEGLYSLSNGVYILAWCAGDTYFPHYIGMTQGA